LTGLLNLLADLAILPQHGCRRIQDIREDLPAWL